MNTTASEHSVEAPDATGVFRIWPGEGSAPGSEHWDWQESTRQAPWSAVPRRLTHNVVIPTVTVFEPRPGTANGTSMVIAPGGAWHFLMIDHEGFDMARWLTGLGVTAFVLKYRLARTPEPADELNEFRNNLQKLNARSGPMGDQPPGRENVREVRLLSEEDGRQAVRWVRQNAARWNLDTDRIGIAGFSAGGGVAMGAVLEHDTDSRPDYGVGVYPAWRGDTAVVTDLPPLFLVISDDDRSVAPLSSARLYEKWQQAGVPAELHIFGNGAHGWGMAKEGFLSDPWPMLLQNWMKFHKLLG
jgi:acetyl esterase/lipase